MAKKDNQITCTVEFTEGAIERITDALMHLYYAIQDGIYEDPMQKDKTA